MTKNLLLAFALALAGTLAVAQESNTPKDPTKQTTDPAVQTKADDKSTTPAQESTGAQSANTDSTSKTTEESSSKEAAASGTKAKAGDRELHEQLHEKFASDPAFADVRIRVQRGVVTLGGHVDSADYVAKAKELAQSVEGVKSVRNHIKVARASASINPDTHANSTAGAKNTTPDVDKSAAGEQGINANATGSIGKDENAANSATSTGGNTSTTPTTNAAGNTVPSNAGSIAGNTAEKSGTQSGRLPASDQSASGTANSGFSSGDSATLQRTIQEKFKTEPLLSSSSVSVNVTDSTIELSGNVATGKEKQTAERIAQSYAGNRKVVDRITVGGSGSAASSPSSNGNGSASGQATPPQPEKPSTPTSANPNSTNGNPPTNQTPPAPEQSTTPK